MTLRTLGLTAAAMTCFAGNSLLCRAALGLELADAASFTSARLVSGAVALSLLVRVSGRPTSGTRDLRAAASLFVYALAFSLAYTRIPAALGALLLFGAVQVTMVSRGLVAGERPGASEWAGILLSLGGLVALTLPGLRQGDSTGSMLMIGAGIAWGVYSLLGRSSRSDPLAATAAHFAYAAPLALVASLLAAGLGAPHLSAPHLSAAGLGLAVASGALASGGGYAIWYAALRSLSATRAALVQLSAPLLAAVGGVLFLGEDVTVRLALAALAILGGIAIAVVGGRR
ncbi:MAG TPA: DMT family transporter [Thermoanaerobaculia bacterium]|nr:DMT family transporter [Thermoanaerobaculia bacterium]